MPASKTVQYTYNTKKQLSSITHNGFNYNFLYDIWGNMTNVSVGTRTLSTNTYDAITGNLTNSAYGTGWHTAYQYDTLGRLISTVTNNANNSYTNGYSTTNYSYNKLGQLSEYYDSLSGITYTYDYDVLGRLSTAYTSDGGNPLTIRLKSVKSKDIFL